MAELDQQTVQRSIDFLIKIFALSRTSKLYALIA